MKRKTGKQLTPSSFSFAVALSVLQNFIQQRSQGLPAKTRTPVLQKASGNRLCRLCYMQQLEEQVLSDGEFADLLTTTMLNGKFFPKISFRKQGSVSALQTQSLL